MAAADGNATIVAGVTDDLTARINAVDLVRVAAEALGGKGGGGRPDMAQAGGPDNGDPSNSVGCHSQKAGRVGGGLNWVRGEWGEERTPHQQNLALSSAALH